MARYIDAHPMEEYINVTNDDKEWLLSQYNADWIMSFIQNQPTADVVEVVRCCECKKHKKHTDVVGYCIEHNIAVVYSDFCSYGERRTDNDL